jgi:vacuolar-type H+-ATPase subunit I/STV1
MPKPRRVSALSSVLKETQEYNKVSQEDEHVTPTTVEQETRKTEKEISADTDKHQAVKTEIQKAVNADLQSSVSTEKWVAAKTPVQKSAKTEAIERTHKQTILIREDLAFRLKVHAARRKETIAAIATRAFEKLLADEGE